MAWGSSPLRPFCPPPSPDRPRRSLTSPSDPLTSRRQRHEISHDEEMVPRLSNFSKQSQTPDPAIQSRPVVAINIGVLVGPMLSQTHQQSLQKGESACPR